MRIEHQRLIPSLLLTMAVSVPAVAQTTTTNCNAVGNYLNCTSNTSPSAEQQYQQNMQQFQQGMANLASALAERRAAAAAQQAAWAAAATEQAKQGAAIARANYEATTVALSRFVADTAPPRVPSVNGDIVLDWSLLDGVESRTEERGEGNVSWDLLTRWALTDTPNGAKVLRIDRSTKTMVKKQHVSTTSDALRFDPASGIMFLTREGKPLYQTIPPAYESTVRVGTHAFVTRMMGHGFDVTVPPGTLDGSLLYSAIAAMPGELASSFQIWIVDAQGEAVPAKIQVAGRKTVKEPVGPPSGTCAGTNGRDEKREAVTLRISAATSFETIDVLAAAPHLGVHPGLRCRIIRR